MLNCCCAIVCSARPIQWQLFYFDYFIHFYLYKMIKLRAEKLKMKPMILFETDWISSIQKNKMNNINVHIFVCHWDIFKRMNIFIASFISFYLQWIHLKVNKSTGMDGWSKRSKRRNEKDAWKKMGNMNDLSYMQHASIENCHWIFDSIWKNLVCQLLMAKCKTSSTI